MVERALPAPVYVLEDRLRLFGTHDRAPPKVRLPEVLVTTRLTTRCVPLTLSSIRSKERGCLQLTKGERDSRARTEETRDDQRNGGLLEEEYDRHQLSDRYGHRVDQQM